MTSLLSDQADIAHGFSGEFVAADPDAFLSELDSLAAAEAAAESDDGLPQDCDDDDQNDHDQHDDDDDDGDLCDDENEAAPRNKVAFALALPTEGDASARRATCVGPSSKRKATATTGSTTSRSTKKTTKTTATVKKPSTAAGARPTRSQSVYQGGGRALSKSASASANLLQPATGIVNKPMGFGVAGSNSLGTFGPAPLTARTAAKQQEGGSTTSRGSSGNKENALEPPAAPLTARTKTVITSRFMVVNNSNKTKNCATIEKAQPQQQQQQQLLASKAALARRSSLTDAMTASANRIAPLAAATTNMKRRSNESNSGDDESPPKKAKTSTGSKSEDAASENVESSSEESRKLNFADANADETTAPPSSDAPSYAELQRQVVRLTCSQIQLENDLKATRAELASKSTSAEEDATMTNALVDALRADVDDKDAQIATLQSDLRSSQQQLTMTQSMLEGAIEAETRLRDDGIKLFDLKQENAKLRSDEKSLRAQVEALEAGQAKSLRATESLATQKFQLAKEVQRLKAMLAKRTAAASAAGASDDDALWTAGESMQFDAASALQDGRRATVAASMFTARR